jgi:hypothetical protein
LDYASGTTSIGSGSTGLHFALAVTWLAERVRLLGDTP